MRYEADSYIRTIASEGLMPIYQYRFSTPNGDRIVERVFPMNSYPQEITVQEGDEIYTAKLTLSLPARMSINWAVKDTVSDLPPENHPEIKSPYQKKQ